MPAQHHHFVFLISARNFSNRVVSRAAFRVGAIDYVELKLYSSAVGKYARDAAIIFVAHNKRRQRFREVVSAIAEGAYLAVLAPRVVHANERAVFNQELINLFVRLRARQSGRVLRFLPPGAAGPP